MPSLILLCLFIKQFTQILHNYLGIILSSRHCVFGSKKERTKERKKNSEVSREGFQENTSSPVFRSGIMKELRYPAVTLWPKLTNRRTWNISREKRISSISQFQVPHWHWFLFDVLFFFFLCNTTLNSQTLLAKKTLNALDGTLPARHCSNVHAHLNGLLIKWKGLDDERKERFHTSSWFIFSQHFGPLKLSKSHRLRSHSCAGVGGVR